MEIDVNLPLLDKIRLVESLEKDERKAIETFIEVAISRKMLKEKITNLLKD